MKPHEETWRTAARPGETACAVYSEVGHLLADLRLRREVAPEAARARLMAAAPEMARALVACGEVIDGIWHTGACINADDPHGKCTHGCIEARGALVKGGVF